MALDTRAGEAIDGWGSPTSKYDIHEPAARLRFERHFTTGDPYDGVNWRTMTARVTGETGVVFEQENVEAPEFWSDQAVNVVASKYFRGHVGQPGRERSVRQLIDRVVLRIAEWAWEGGYVDQNDAGAFRDELTHLMLYQMAAFNSPVWFNVGIEEKPQVSACFILAVEDSMESILRWYRDEGFVFKGGSGSGINVSNLRSGRELLHGGGKASGPVSFMRAADASAAVIKSGGKTRRAAKMVVMDVDHPDILDFITCKSREERKAWALIDAGFDASIDGEAYRSVYFQNANHSVRVTDTFMTACESDGTHHTYYRANGRECADTHQARELLRAIAENAHTCGDPGVQFDDEIQRWHTCPNSGRINASNPCSEYMHLDNSACNLASLRLVKFLDDKGVFDVEGFCYAVRLMTTAMDVLVDNASYPTETIAQNAHKFRELGLGYADLGASIMRLGMAYDSDKSRDFAGAVTALMTGESYRQSAEMAGVLGPYEGYEANAAEHTRVVEQHLTAARKQQKRSNSRIADAAAASWMAAHQLGLRHGYRNSQATVIAPTGTIAFMMDCDTTGVEPDIALIKVKKLVGGGEMAIVNQSVPAALERLGYTDTQAAIIEQHIKTAYTMEGAPYIKPEDLPVFDCAFKPKGGTRTIPWLGHLLMLGAVQPFVSGSISKTINMPAEATVEDIETALITAWKLRLKAVAIYRDGSKRMQPLTAGREAVPMNGKLDHRRKLPDTRQSLTHKFDIAGQEGYITVGLFEDGRPGEMFVRMSKEGSTISGLLDFSATLVSFALQYGVPLEFLVRKFSHMRFEPSGFTKNPQVPNAKSLPDYIFRWLASQFLPAESQAEVGVVLRETAALDLHVNGNGNGHVSGWGFVNQADAPNCPDCGSIMIRNGTCYRCLNCGATSGCS